MKWWKENWLGVCLMGMLVSLFIGAVPWAIRNAQARTAAMQKAGTILDQTTIEGHIYIYGSTMSIIHALHCPCLTNQ